jgi:4-diphosphocytidyl-2-C-methyl-D-erythritol kinase
MTVTRRAHAKLNVFLRVLGARDDGYHDIQTLILPLELYDVVTAERAEGFAVTVTGARAAELARAGGEELVERAARAWAHETGRESPGATLTVDKRIPVAAGLGGGSSDAAATLWGLNRLWGLRWPRARLQELAVELGMDVPFFLGTGRAVARGRGERLQALPGGGGYALVLVNPRAPLSTREVYGRVPAGWHAEPTGTERVIEALRRRNVATLAAALTNNLERVVEPVLPVIGRMKAALLAAGALGAIMSGSGPTVFGLARSLDHARQVRSRVSRAGWACWAVRTNSGPAIRASR